MSKSTASKRSASQFDEPDKGPILSVRFVLALILFLGGIAWVAYYYTQVRVDPTVLPAPKPGGPKFMADLGDWNYLIGFGALLVGLMISAHPSTPLGRGRGVVIGMLGCFLFGLLWICTYYLFAERIQDIWVMDDLGNYNLAVGVGFMAVGFSFATRWE